MRAIAAGSLLLNLFVVCQRKDEPAPAPRPSAIAIATTSASASSQVTRKDEPLTPELKRLLEVLRAGAGHRGETRGTFEELRRAIGPEAKDWRLPEMLKQLETAGEIAIHVLSTDAGANPAYVLSAWRD
jgi:hypothetical protein